MRLSLGLGLVAVKLGNVIASLLPSSSSVPSSSVPSSSAPSSSSSSSSTPYVWPCKLVASGAGYTRLNGFYCRDESLETWGIDRVYVHLDVGSGLYFYCIRDYVTHGWFLLESWSVLRAHHATPPLVDEFPETGWFVQIAPTMTWTQYTTEIDCAECRGIPSSWPSSVPSSRPSSWSSSTPSSSAPSSSGEFPGAGWYCMSYYTGEGCEALVLNWTDCVYVADQAAWDAYQIDVCRLDGATWVKYTYSAGPASSVEECAAFCEEYSSTSSGSEPDVPGYYSCMLYSGENCYSLDEIGLVCLYLSAQPSPLCTAYGEFWMQYISGPYEDPECTQGW